MAISTVKIDEQLSIDLISKYNQGDSKSLESLLKMYEPFIYNVAWKFAGDPESAKEICQDVLIKIATKLNTFQGKSAFKTWVYKIAYNEFLQTKRRPMESKWDGFDEFSHDLNKIPSPELSAEEELEKQDRTKTARFRCMTGMLMCMSREQRLIYLIGHVFNVDHNVGAEVFGISKENYRKKLSRAKKDFQTFANGQCGLVNTNNPCRCSKKAKAMEAAGRMQTDKRLFDPTYSSTIAKYAESVQDEVADIVDKKYAEFFQAHSTKEDFTADTVVKEIINDPELHKHFN